MFGDEGNLLVKLHPTTCFALASRIATRISVSAVRSAREAPAEAALQPVFDAFDFFGMEVSPVMITCFFAFGQRALNR